MKAPHFTPATALLAGLTIMFSCRMEDPGPRQQDLKSIDLGDFDRLEISGGLDVTVKQGATFSILAQGDRRNLADLEVKKEGGTAAFHFKAGGNRQYTTFITIYMPELSGADFSGGATGKISGFLARSERLDISLSGGSSLQAEIGASSVFAWLTGASNLRLVGFGDRIDASVTGSSQLSSFDYPAAEVKLLVAGASEVRVNVSQLLEVSASGQSDVLYRGSPTIEQNILDSSTLKKD